jgi:hypothetical protein
MLSIQGDKALSFLWDTFREECIRRNPGINMNDAERAFLYRIAFGLAYDADIETRMINSADIKQVTTLIEEIA